MHKKDCQCDNCQDKRAYNFWLVYQLTHWNERKDSLEELFGHLRTEYNGLLRSIYEIVKEAREGKKKRKAVEIYFYSNRRKHHVRANSYFFHEIPNETFRFDWCY